MCAQSATPAGRIASYDKLGVGGLGFGVARLAELGIGDLNAAAAEEPGIIGGQPGGLLGQRQRLGRPNPLGRVIRQPQHGLRLAVAVTRLLGGQAGRLQQAQRLGVTSLGGRRFARHQVAAGQAGQVAGGREPFPRTAAAAAASRPARRAACAWPRSRYASATCQAAIRHGRPRSLQPSQSRPSSAKSSRRRATSRGLQRFLTARQVDATRPPWRRAG